MPEMVWNQYELIEFLTVLPTVEEYETLHEFELWRDGLRLLLSIYQHSAEVYLSLFRETAKAPLFKVRMIDCNGIMLVRNPKGNDCLEFAAAKVFGGRYDDSTLIPMGLRLVVDPDFQIELFYRDV